MSKSVVTLSIKGLEIFDELPQEILNAVNEGLDDIAQDLKRVSSGVAPLKTGKLKDSYTHNKSNSGGVDVHEISYSAYNKTFNYAAWTHDADYKLGKLSKKRIPPLSAYSNEQLKVGKGYLIGTYEILEADYLKHLEEVIYAALKNYK